MNPKKLSDKELLKETEIVVKKEKALTVEVLRHLQEIERRKLFCDLGFSSLFTYCTEHLGYSGNEAYCRISAMRLMSESELVEQALEVGQLSLSNAAKAYSHIKGEEKESGLKLELEQKEEVARELFGKTTREAEQILDNKKGKDRPKLTKITLSAQTMELLQEYKELCGDLSNEEIIQALLKEKLKKLKEPRKMRTMRRPAPTNTRTIPAMVKAQVRARSKNQCEFVRNGRRCSARRYLQFDHIHPFALGGQSDLENIRHYCPNHNLRGAMKTFGIEKMRQRMLRSPQ